jgi:hypothetical protein
MALHFVGFKDGRYWKAEARYLRAVEIFGEPDFVHRRWDARVIPDVAPGDTVVWANRSPDLGACLPPYFHHVWAALDKYGTAPGDGRTFDDSREDIIAHGGEKGVDYV